MDVAPGALMRKKVAPQMGNDIQPNIGLHVQNLTKIFDIKPEATFFLTRHEFDNEKRIGQHFSCLTQVSSLFPSNDLDIKHLFVEAIKEYARKYDDRPECFSVDKFFPRTYLLYKKQECLDFFKAFNSLEYKTLKEERKIVYIRKIGENIHNGEGVEPLTDKKEDEMRVPYDNGNKCGQITKRYLMQDYIHNALLIQGRKLDFRIYLLFASTNPLIVYYHDGFVRVSLEPYDASSDDKSILLTNLALSDQISKDAKNGVLYKGMTDEEIKHSQQWRFERLRDYLLETNVITDPKWLDNYLRPQFKKAFAHLVRFSLKDMYEHSSVYQLYGLDFMLDTNLNIWFIEANSIPGLDGYSKSMEKFIVKMLKDHIELVTGLLRSRMKRIIEYVNMIIEEGGFEDGGKEGFVIKDLEFRKIGFKEITKNYFEKEFEPSSRNGFSKVVDENYSGVEKYLGFIEQECL